MKQCRFHPSKTDFRFSIITHWKRIEVIFSIIVKKSRFGLVSLPLNCFLWSVELLLLSPLLDFFFVRYFAQVDMHRIYANRAWLKPWKHTSRITTAMIRYTYCIAIHATVKRIFNKIKRAKNIASQEYWAHFKERSQHWTHILFCIERRKRRAFVLHKTI